MSDTDPDRLADQLEQEADKLEHHSDELGQKAEQARQDWERKRRDQNVPGAPQPLPDSTEEGETSPGPEAPPQEEHPAAAEMASEGATGPPKDQIDDSASRS